MTEAGDATIGARLAQDRLEHRAARLDRVVTALRARAAAYDELPHGLALALSDFERQLRAVRAASTPNRPARRSR